jgi:type II secretory pathway predicted ATPase ExeA
MYTEYYGLKEKPFNLTPSPRFIYMSEGHREAMALLRYGVTERKGFILLTGEVGTGKTTLIHNLISNLDNTVEHVYLVNPLLSPEEFLDFLAFSCFKKRIHFKSKTDFLLEFQDYLQTCLNHQKIFILIVDEAHKLSFELLEEIRLLSNMEFAEEKLINIFLVGQPELNDNLNSPGGRATLQRIGVRYDIPPLSLTETGEYLKTRMAIAGSSGKSDVFQKDAVEALYRYSLGYPRTINILADNALLLGYSRDKKTITSSMIKESYDAMSLEDSFLTGPKQKKPSNDTIEATEHRQSHPFRWAVISVIIILLALFAVLARTSLISLPDFLTVKHNPGSSTATPGASPVSNNMIKSGDVSKGDDGGDGPANRTTAKITDSQKNQEIAATGKISQYNELKNLKVFLLGRDAGFSKSTVAKKGDTLTDLAKKVYGTVGEDELSILKKHNPEIKDVNLIEVGQKISFPVYTILVGFYENSVNADLLYQQLKNDGFDVNIISSKPDDPVKSFLVTVGVFRNKNEAESFASDKLEGRHYNMPKNKDFEGATQ